MSSSSAAPSWTASALNNASDTSHALFRLGEDFAVRLPRHADAARQAEKEQRWLPELAPQLPLAVPVPLEHGHPDTEYPFPWSILPWLEGDSADRRSPDSFDTAADALGTFVSALRLIDAHGGPGPGPHNFHRGVPLRERDMAARQALDALRETGSGVDTSTFSLWPDAWWMRCCMTKRERRCPFQSAAARDHA